MLTRCVKLISSTLTDQILADRHPEEMMPPNVEFLISPLDLLSGIVQGLGPKIEPLIAQTNPPLLALLGRCIHVNKEKSDTPLLEMTSIILTFASVYIYIGSCV